MIKKTLACSAVVVLAGCGSQQGAGSVIASSAGSEVASDTATAVAAPAPRVGGAELKLEQLEAAHESISAAIAAPDGTEIEIVGIICPYGSGAITETDPEIIWAATSIGESTGGVCLGPRSSLRIRRKFWPRQSVTTHSSASPV